MLSESRGKKETEKNRRLRQFKDVELPRNEQDRGRKKVFFLTSWGIKKKHRRRRGVGGKDDPPRRDDLPAVSATVWTQK